MGLSVATQTITIVGILYIARRILLPILPPALIGKNFITVTLIFWFRVKDCIKGYQWQPLPHFSKLLDWVFVMILIATRLARSCYTNLVLFLAMKNNHHNAEQKRKKKK